jgi:cytochrome c oxidase assembly protein subunit 15
MVVLMVVVGGLTRLTESGLSMVRWEPVKGTLPPMTQSAWEEEFADYRTSPQYQQVFKGMSLEEFKGIFWLEYLHRLFGRLTGLVFLLPLIWFAATRKLSRPEVLKFTGIFFLGGLQGLMGWYMVKSGLVNDPQVSPYRLTAHLLLAFSIFALLWWEFLRRCPLFAPPLRGGGERERAGGARRGWG